MSEETELKVVKIHDINPVDYFNRNHVQYVMNFICSIKNVKPTGINSVTYVSNKSDENKRMIVIEDDCFIAKEPNGLNLEVEKRYTPFMIIQKLRFKDKFWLTLNFVIHEIMGNKSNYIRVGTKYYKKIIKVDRNDIERSELKVWEKQIIIDDYGKQFLDEIPRFDDFTMEPDNKNYKPIIGNNYNLYSKFEHKPSKKYVNDAQTYWIRTLLEHIFGDQYELGLKYMKVLYDMPKQKLPILVLVSNERSTGKTTFVDFLEMLFGANSVIINPENIGNQFNGAYADKNVIMIEESRFENIQATEKLKNLATQKKILVNTKFIQHYSVPFHGHIIITSNDERKFSKVDDPEIRYWVRKVPTLKGKANHNILNDMVKEIPYFLYELNQMPKIDNTKSRMVFEAAEIQTKELEDVKRESLPSLHKEILLLLEDICYNNTSVEIFYFTAKEIKEEFFKFNSKIETHYINTILKDSIRLDKSNMMRYIPIEKEGVNSSIKKKSGRPFIFKNEFYDSNKTSKRPGQDHY